MSKSVNTAILLGNLGRDPIASATQTGKMLCKFSIATSYGVGAARKTDWHNIVAFDDLANTCALNLKKGMEVYVEGRISYNKWVDKQGVKRESTSIMANKVEYFDTKQEKVTVESRPAVRTVSNAQPTPAKPETIPHWQPPSEEQMFMDDLPF